MRLLALAVLMLLGAGCAAGARLRPVASAGAALDPVAGSLTAEAEGVRLVARTPVWRGTPAFLPVYVTPLFLELANGSPHPLRYEHADLRLFDEQRFQYTALPPGEVARILRWSATAGPRVSLAAAVGVGHRRGPLLWDPWWWWPPPPYPAPPPVDRVFLEALPVGTLQPAARVEGFVYFPRLRPAARRLTFEMHYRLGEAPRVFTLSFAVEHGAGHPGGRALARS